MAIGYQPRRTGDAQWFRQTEDSRLMLNLMEHYTRSAPRSMPGIQSHVRDFVKTLFRVRWKLLWGTPRRLFWNVCRPGYVRASLAQRSGKCRRCGVCCRLVWRCRYFHYVDGIPSCRIYTRYRPSNCRNFPIDHRDLADRNLVSPNEPCGFSWAPVEEGNEPSNE